MSRILMLGCAAAVAVVAGATTVQAGSSQKGFTIKSTLTGKTFLPHRIHWTAFPSLRRTEIAKVEFFIEGGKPRWIDHEAPFTYADDGGYLVTSWLGRGRWRFTVRATATDGRKASETIDAFVGRAAGPPEMIDGKWRRTIDTTNAPKPGSAGNPTETLTPSGTYTLTFENRWIRDHFPGKFIYPESNDTGNGLVFLSDYTAGPAFDPVIHVQGEVVFHPLSLKQAEGGAWCYFWGPPADYDWTVSGDTLTLAPVGGKDACRIRGFIWTGEWTRVK